VTSSARRLAPGASTQCSRPLRRSLNSRSHGKLTHGNPAADAERAFMDAVEI
jgi:hypothetical protein